VVFILGIDPVGAEEITEAGGAMKTKENEIARRVSKGDEHRIALSLRPRPCYGGRR